LSNGRYQLSANWPIIGRYQLSADYRCISNLYVCAVQLLSQNSVIPINQCAKNYHSRWKFDKVMAKTILQSFFGDTVYIVVVRLSVCVCSRSSEANASQQDNSSAAAQRELSSGPPQFGRRKSSADIQRPDFLSPAPVGYEPRSLPYLTFGWAGCYACPAMRPYQFGPMRSPDVTRRSQ